MHDDETKMKLEKYSR